MDAACVILKNKKNSNVNILGLEKPAINYLSRIILRMNPIGQDYSVIGHLFWNLSFPHLFLECEAEIEMKVQSQQVTISLLCFFCLLFQW